MVELGYCRENIYDYSMVEYLMRSYKVKEIVNICPYKVGNNSSNIVNLVRLWKTRMESTPATKQEIQPTNQFLSDINCTYM